MNNRRLSDSKNFGLTGSQLTILGVFGVVTLGVIGIMAWIVINSSALPGPVPSQPILADTPTPLPSETFTHAPTRTSIPTFTPTSTSTMIPYEARLPKGWTQHKVNTVELWLPPFFMKQTTNKLLLYYYDPGKDQYLFQTNVGLSSEAMPSTDLDTYVTEGLKKFSPDTIVVAKKKMMIGPYETIRITLEVWINADQVEEAVYIIRDGDTYWDITCACQINEFIQKLPLFDQIANTFRVVP